MDAVSCSSSSRTTKLGRSLAALLVGAFSRKVFHLCVKPGVGAIPA